MNLVQAFNIIKAALEQYYRGLPQEQRQVEQAMASLAEVINSVNTKKPESGKEPPQKPSESTSKNKEKK